MSPTEDIGPSVEPTVASLVSMLEEGRFRQLFRYMANMPDERELEVLPAVPGLMGDQELLVRRVNATSSFGSISASWAFQSAYVPAGFWSSASLAIQLKERMNVVRQAIDRQPGLASLLRGENIASRRDEAAYDPDERYLYMATNVAKQFDGDEIHELTSHFRSLFGSPSGPRDDDIQFGMWTPLTILRKHPREVEKFILDLLNTPSGYSFVAREGKIVVVPEAEHGLHLVADGPRTHAATATSRFRFDVPGIADLETLVNASGTKEADIQYFLQEHPHFLEALEGCGCEVRSHLTLVGPGETKLVPDFMIRLEDTERWNILEIKKPNVPLLLRNKQSEILANSAAKAVAQLLGYNDALNMEAGRTRLRELVGSTPYDPTLTVLIGRGASDRRYRWVAPRGGLPDVDLVTYDYLLERAKSSVRLVSDLDARFDE